MKVKMNTKMIGQIFFSKTPARSNPRFAKKVDNDYFISLKITKIGDYDIKTTQDAFAALRINFPKIYVQDFLLNNNLFTKPSLPPNADDISHITLGYFPDFRIDRDLNKDIDIQKVSAAKSFHGEILNLEISQENFQLVTTCDIRNLRLNKG